MNSTIDTSKLSREEWVEYISNIQDFSERVIEAEKYLAIYPEDINPICYDDDTPLINYTPGNENTRLITEEELISEYGEFPTIINDLLGVYRGEIPKPDTNIGVKFIKPENN